MEKKEKPLKKVRYFDYSMVFIIIALVSFGLIMIYSSSAYSAQFQFGTSTRFFRSQLKAVIIGLVGMVIISWISYHIWVKHSLTIYVLAAFLCLIVNFVGEEYNGQKRWIRLGGNTFQPSEIGKIAVILLVAYFVAKAPKSLEKFRNVLKVLGFVLLVAVFVAFNNLSTAIIIGGIGLIMLFVAYPGYKDFLLLLLALLAAGAAGLAITGGYRMQRVTVWLNPEDSTEGYQVLQGLYAIGSGGVFGKGLGQGIQKLSAVPEAENDMIFSIVCEELGIVGALCLILMYVFLLWRIWRIAVKVEDVSGQMICIGVMSHIGIQAIMNIAVATNSMPNTGVSLPFVSYGGTAVAITLAEMGLVLNVSREIKFDV